MGKQKRGRRSNRNNRNNKYGNAAGHNNAVASAQVPYKDEKPEGVLPQDVLFRPCLYERGDSDLTVDFEHMMVPFMLNGNRLFSMLFMDGIGVSAYIECHELGKSGRLRGRMDGTDLVKECMEVEKLTGAPYYFGKLDKCVEYYLYAMQLFMDRNILSKQRALEILAEFGFAAGDMASAKDHVEAEIEKSKEYEARSKAEAKNREKAGDAMMKFVTDILASSGPNA